MSDYIFLVNAGDRITNEVCITKLVQNRLASDKSFFDFKVGVYTQKFTDKEWTKLDEIVFKDNTIKLNSTDYKLLVGQIAVIVPCRKDYIFNDNLSELPEPVNRSGNKSPVNIRASIAFIRGSSKSSYQGDFPYNMTRIKGSFLAFDALVNNSHKAVKSKLVFVNIFSKKLVEKKSFNLFMANSKNKKIVDNVNYYHNSAAILENITNDDNSVIFYSKDTLGIPIFISFTDDLSQNISVEHSHPPAEYFWGESKFFGQSIIKSKWLKLLS